MSRTESLNRLAYLSFREQHPAPERGLRRALFLLGEEGSMLRGMGREVGIKEGWWRAPDPERILALVAISSSNSVAERATQQNQEPASDGSCETGLPQLEPDQPTLSPNPSEPQ